MVLIGEPSILNYKHYNMFKNKIIVNMVLGAVFTLLLLKYIIIGLILTGLTTILWLLRKK